MCGIKKQKRLKVHVVWYGSSCKKKKNILHNHLNSKSINVPLTLNIAVSVYIELMCYYFPVVYKYMNGIAKVYLPSQNIALPGFCSP